MDTQPSPQASYAIILQIVTWLLMVVSGFAFLARISTKWAMTKALNGDDIASVVSLVCNFGAGASVTILAFNGLGEDRTTLNESKFLVFQKVSNLLTNCDYSANTFRVYMLYSFST